MLLAAPAPSVAQEGERFFDEDSSEEEAPRKTHYSGSLTSSTLFFRETGGLGVPVERDGALPPAVPPESASRIDRFFTDTRAQLNARHIRGGNWDFRADVRARYVPGACRDLELPDEIFTPGNDFSPCNRIQSGTFGGNEYHVIELYFRRQAGDTEVTIGRQFAMELAATRVDGIHIRRRRDENWSYLGFAGLHPWRISRDLRDDYPVLVNPLNGEESRVTPVTGGAGASYRFEKIYGAFGAVAIFPLTGDLAEYGGTGASETPRIFATSNGYWRQSPKLDFYHFLVLDGRGAGGASLTNLSLGANYRPAEQVRTFFQVDRVDTETLNVQAQTRLQDPDAMAGNVVLNNVEVLRVASEAARAGVAGDFKQNRFGVSMTGALRQRPEFVLNRGQANEVIFNQARAVDLTLRAVDRRSFRDLRLGATATRSFGLGDTNLNRGDFLVTRVDAAKQLKGGRAEVEAHVTYLRANDEIRTQICGSEASLAGDLLNCYGTSRIRSLSVGGLAFYRFKPNWFALGSAEIARQFISTADALGGRVSQPSILMTTFFGRIAYRF